MRHVESLDGTRIAYVDVGSGPPTVLVPGINFSGAVFEPIVTALADERRLIAIDPRGHGASDKPAGDYSWETMADDVGAVIDELGLDGVTLIGWSMGGAIAAKWASRASPMLKRVVLASAAAPRFTSAPDFKHGLPAEAVQGLIAAERADRPGYRRSVIEQSFHLTQSAERLDWLWGLSMQTPSWASVRCLESLLTEDLRADLPKIEAPTLVIRGAQDAFVSAAAAQATVDAIPDSQYCEFPESAHIPHLEEPDAFAQLLRDLS